MAHGGWQPGTAGQHGYWGGSYGGGSWPTWSAVQATTPAAAEAADPAGSDGAPAGQHNTSDENAAGPSDGQWQPTWQGQSWGTASWGQGGWSGGDWRPWWWQQGSNTKGGYSDPPAWGGWASYRLWKKALVRWNQNTDVPVWRRFEKLSKQLDWDLQSRFEHVSEQVLAGPDYLQALLEILDGIAGEKDVSEKRRVVRAALFEGQRRKDETLSQFAVRREQEFAGADRYLNIPSELKAFILQETAGLSKQGVQNLRTLTSGSTDFDRVVGALKTLDVEEEPLTKAKGSFLAGVTQDAEDPEAGEDDSGDDGEASPGDAAEVEAFLAEVTDVEESVALEMLAAFEKDGSGRGNQRRTWRQNKDRKLAARTGVFSASRG